MMNTHEFYMNRCLQLAQNGLGTTYPNPLVGSVIVHNGKIIGEGWHRKSGEAHAEVHAVNSVADKSELPMSTLYVNLEPCSHFGKTPPCSDMIIENKIRHVVIGTVDPHSVVSGRGIERLRNAGITVEVGVLERECTELNKRFFCFQNNKRPYIILKWAESIDGFIAPENRKAAAPVWITNAYSRQFVHKWRTEEHAILIGTQTAVDDNPSLTARDWAGNNPIRVVVDRMQRISPESHIFDNQAETLLLTGKSESNLTIDFNTAIAPQIASLLHRNDIVSVIVEGGTKTLQSFIDAGLWDEARIFRGTTLLHGGTKAPLFTPGVIPRRMQIDGDELLIFER